jgi:hypothetical protein
MESLAVGAKGFIFNTHECVDIGRILEESVVFELESLADDDDKAFFVGLILSMIAEYRQSLARRASGRQDESLRHILVIEEAHRLLKHISTERTSEMIGNPRGKAVETFCNIIAEMRSFGQGVIVAEQIPTKIAPDVIKNTNTKIIHRLVSSDDQKVIGASLGLPDSDCHYLNQLLTGFALVHKEGMARPMEVCVHNTLSNHSVGDELVKERSRDFFDRNGDDLTLLQNQFDANLALHESGLLDDPEIPVISRRLLNTVLISEKELQDLLPLAVKAVRNSHRSDYLQNSTIERALEYWFSRILLSPSMDMGDGRIPTDDVLDGIQRFWSEPNKFTRERLVHRINKWRGEKPCIPRVLEVAATSVACEISGKNDDREVLEAIACEFLTYDIRAVSLVSETLRKMIL